MLRSLIVGVGATLVVAQAHAQAATSASASSAAQGERRGWFGITLSCEECFVLRGPDRIAYVRFPAVLSVETGSPAAVGGMRRGDTLIAVEGMPLTTTEGFQRYAEARANQPLRVTVRSNGQSRELTITPAERGSASTIRDFYVARLRVAQRRGLEALRGGFRSPMGTLGLALDCERCSQEVFGGTRNWRFLSPAAVTMVDVDGPGHVAGIRRGDTVTAVNGHDITSVEGARALSTLEPGQRLTLTIRRGGQDRRMPVTAAMRPDATREELAVFEEYRRMRDSTEAIRRTEIATMTDIGEIQVAPRMLRMRPDAVVQLSATVYGADGMPRPVGVRWQSNNINVVEVSPDGTVRAIAPGTAIVQAIVEGAGRRRAGQAAVTVTREGPPPGRPGLLPNEPVPPAEPNIFVSTRHPDSLAKTLVNCNEPAVNAINPGRACYDERAEPRGSTMVPVPAACEGSTGPATLMVRVSQQGQATEARVFAPSNCQDFTEAAMRAARAMTYTPARAVGGTSIASWFLLRMRPAGR